MARLLACVFLLGLSLTCLIATSEAVQHTHIDNHLDVAILGTVDPETGKTGFNKRRIPAGASDVDEYNPQRQLGVTISSTVDECTTFLTVSGDESVSVDKKYGAGNKLIKGFNVKGNKGASSTTGCF